MRLLTFICAEQCAIDGPTNRVSFFNLLEEIKTPIFPSAMYLTTIFSLWERELNEPSDFDALVIIKMNDTEILRNPLKVNFQGELRCRAMVVVQGLVLPGPGLLTIEIDGGPDLSGIWRVNVEQLRAGGP
jgi:hypothetical protein